jgi:uncharacterized membrane-anchored protein YhcB (DUF1043 family)
MAESEITFSLKNYNKLISDFCLDLSRTFPEYREQWQKWESTDLPEEELKNLLGYMAQVFPERFFDIIYQNEEVFTKKTASEANTCFLPSVDFRNLFLSNISENTKQTLWKYLQLILFQIMEEVKSKNAFGETANIFEGIKEEDLHKKLVETFESMKDFFTKQPKEEGSEETGEPQETPFSNINMDSLQGHIRKLMDGKIGSLVKELMDELKDDFQAFQDEVKGHFDEGESDKPPEMGEIMKQLMKDPTKVMKILKKVSDKLKTHMTGDNQREYMNETMDILKQMGGREEFMKMFEQMKHTMAGGGKNMRVDQNALARMEKQMNIRDRMRRNLKKKKEEEAKATTEAKTTTQLKVREDGTQVFKIEGQEQPKTMKEDIEKIMKDLGLEDDVKKPVVQNKKSKK